MFNAPFIPDLSRRIVAPLAVQYAFEASPKWHAQNPGSIDAVGNLLLQAYTVEIQNWLQGARHNARNSNLPIWRSRYTLPGMSAEYTRAGTNERLRLIAQPEKAGGKVPTIITIDIADVIKVKPDFHGWPIPGYDLDPTTTLYWRPANAYFWDPACAPGWPNQDEAVLNNGADICLQGMLQSLTRTLSDWSDKWIGQDTFLNPNHGTEGGTVQNDGYVSKLWQKIQCGSKVVPVKLAGNQYWEVLIKTLNTDVPGSVSSGAFISGNPNTPRGGGFNSNYYGPRLDDGFGGQGSFQIQQTWQYDLTLQGTAKRVFSNKLNTWLTPAIGVLPEYALVKSGKGFSEDTPAVIGLDKDLTKSRSIGAVRTSHIMDPTTFKTPLFAGGVFTGYQDGSPDPSSRADNLVGDVFQSYATSATFGAVSEIESMPPFADPGVNCPVFVGRGDNLDDYRTTTDPGLKNEKPNLWTFGAGPVNANAYYTGINLGELKEGDVVMLASKVNAKTGVKELFFGRNGQWYDSSGPAGTKLPPKGIKMDEGNYYPAVSWRVGGMEARILLGAAQKHTPPAGFDRLSKTPSFTIPGSAKDDPKAT